jgi:hypothetical protein
MTTPRRTAHPLVGRAFHSFNAKDQIRWQGEVLADMGDGYFLLQLMEWMGGEETYQVIIHISAFSHVPSDDFSRKNRFVFYDTAEDRNNYYYAKQARS